MAIDIVRDQDSLHTTLCSNENILTIIDCSTRFAMAVPLSNQRSESVIYAVIENLITVFNIPRNVLTDQRTNFKSEIF